MKRVALVTAILAGLSATVFAQDNLEKHQFVVTVINKNPAAAPGTQDFTFNLPIGETMPLSSTKQMAYTAAVTVKDGVQKVTPGLITYGFTGSVHPVNVDKSGAVQTDVAFAINDLIAIDKITSGGVTIEAPKQEEFANASTIWLKPNSGPVIVASYKNGVEISVAMKN